MQIKNKKGDVIFDDADLRSADLRSANLSGANLGGADLRSAKLSESWLDPEKKANGDVEGFVTVGTHVTGYRTRKAGHIDKYRDGWTYSADWFSVADTECHPGLYLWPTLAQAKEFSPNDELISVSAPAEHVHKAGTKWRCRWFTVIGEAK